MIEYKFTCCDKLLEKTGVCKYTCPGQHEHQCSVCGKIFWIEDENPFCPGEMPNVYGDDMSFIDLRKTEEGYIGTNDENGVIYCPYLPILKKPLYFPPPVPSIYEEAEIGPCMSKEDFDTSIKKEKENAALFKALHKLIQIESL